MRTYLLLFLLLLSSVAGHSQDYLIKYHSEAEKKQLSNSNDYKTGFRLALLANLDEQDAIVYQARVDAFVEKSSYNFSTSKEDKKLKSLFQEVHNHFLKQYEEKATFDEIFKTGTFQCLNASLLYAYILESLKVPYEIKETPTHVYVVAHPQTHNIMIETTDAAKGYYVPTERTKEDYINQLVKMKYLEQNYVSRVGIEQAFNEFFYGKANVSFVEAVGLLYYNTAINEAEAKNYAGAYSAIFKSYQLYPAKKSEYMKVAYLSEVVRNLKLEKIAEWDALVALSQITGDFDNREYLKYKFSEAMGKYLLKGSMKSKTDSIYNYLSVNLKDSVLKSEIEEHYLQETSRFLYISNKYDQAKVYLEKAIAKNPNNAFTRSMLTDYVLRREITNMGSSQNIKKLDEWTSRFNFLKNNENVQSAYLYNYAFMCFKHMDNEQFVAAEKHFKLMASVLGSHENLNKDEELLGKAFIGTAMYYFTKKQKQKVIEVLELGSKHCPNNSEFQLMYKNRAKLLAKM